LARRAEESPIVTDLFAAADAVGVSALKGGEHEKLGRMRINLTFRGAL
jgi:hypothetical protein